MSTTSPSLQEAPSLSGGTRQTPLLEVRDLVVSFSRRGDAATPMPANHDDAPRKANQRVIAVCGAEFTSYPGQTLAIVGESGCGKSVTALSIMRLIEPQGRIERGSIKLNGGDLRTATSRAMRAIRGHDIAMIFQEPMTSLNPVFTIGDQIIETVRLHQRVSSAQAESMAVQALKEVGINDAPARLRSYPHEFSGGMRQRVMIAMALACRPKLLLADEPTTALDVTIQQQILALLRRLQRERSMGMALITHDLGVVAQHADVVCVMYAGRVMEYATVLDLFAHPLHPYTRGLLKCKPDLNRRSQRLTTIEEIVNDPDQFTRLNVGGGSLRPWWPVSREHGVAKSSTLDDADRSVLCEVETNHWVGCHANHVADYLAARRPDLDYRRDENSSNGTGL